MPNHTWFRWVLSLLVILAQVLSPLSGVLREIWSIPQSPPADGPPPPAEEWNLPSQPFPPQTGSAAPLSAPILPNLSFDTINFGQPYKDTNNPEDHPGRIFAGPVNLVNGNFFLTVGDHFFPAAGVAVQFARAYNSLDTRDGPLGHGWTHSYNTSVITETASLVVVRETDGSLFPYAFDGIQWRSMSGFHRQLAHTAGGPFVITHKNGLVQTFDFRGRLRSIADRNGNEITLGYNEDGLLTTVADGSGRQLLIAYNPSSRIEQVTDPIGRATQYIYDPAGNLINVFYPEGGVALYGYGPGNRMMMYQDSRQPPGEGHGEILYDPAGKVQRFTYGVDSFFDVFYNPGETRWQDALGVNRHIVYNPATGDVLFDGVEFAGMGMVGEQLTYTADRLLQSKIDAEGRLTGYEYDALGNLVRAIAPSGAETRYAYSLAFNNVISTTNPAGQRIFYTYDLKGNLINEIRPGGAIFTYTHNTAGDLLGIQQPDGAERKFLYDASGNLRSEFDPLGNETVHDYDPVGRVISSTNPAGAVTFYAYDAADRLLRLVDPLGGVISYTYDSRSNLVNLTNARGQVYTNTYDNLDRLVKVTDPLGVSTGYFYDGASRLIERRAPGGEATLYAYDEAGRMIRRSYSSGRSDTFGYDRVGNLIQAGDGAITTTLRYDAENRPLTITLQAPGFTATPRLVYQYDAMGNRTRVRLSDGSSTYQVQYSYDPLNRLVATQTGSGRTWTTAYDLAGNRQRLTYPDGSYAQYTHDPAGRLTQAAHYNAAHALQRNYTYTYDAQGNTLQENDDGQASSYTYDLLNRLESALLPEGNFTFAYDAASNLLSAAGPHGNSAYTYDLSNHRLTGQGTTYTYDDLGRRIQEEGALGKRTFTYDEEARLTQATSSVWDDTDIVHIVYDAQGQMVNIQDGASNTFLLQYNGRTEAELDGSGHLKRVFTIDKEVVAMTTLGPPAVTYDYRYDGRGRVRWVTDAATGQTLFTYSANPSEDVPGFYNPIRMAGAYFLPRWQLYALVDGQFWEPFSGLFLFRFRPWAFWPYGPFHPWRWMFHWWPWPWPWPRPWGWLWPHPWPFLWPWPGIWLRPFLIWPLWPWPVQPWFPWWWWGHWWGWTPWMHWWFWRPLWWWQGWWHWGWWGGWWWWPYGWWHWLWWWPCWWCWWAWWGWWNWWWFGWWWWMWWRPWWWFWGAWQWWWPVYWLPVFPRPPDYGDAADPLYPSLLANNGARHLDPSYEWLGAWVDREYNARITNLDAFDDGIQADLGRGVITITVTTSGAFWRYSAAAPIHVHGWVDWNKDGDWADPGEMVVNWSGYPGGAGWPALTAAYKFVALITVPVSANGQYWARFRLDYARNLGSPTGMAAFGEVEDHLFFLRRLWLPLVRK